MRRTINDRFLLVDGEPRAGGMADVYQGLDLAAEGTPSPVAVKLLRTADDREAVYETFFRREVRALQELRHPHIVRMLAAGKDQATGEFFVVLEWIESTLLNYVGEPGSWGWDDFADQFALPVLDGLSHAHERAVVHRDVKPSNILVDEHGVPKLADFGVSKLKSKVVTGEATVAAYMSKPFCPPEEDSYSGYSRDVFAFGVTVLACLATVRVADYGDFPAALDNLDVPPDVAAIIERSIAFDPKLRPANAGVLLGELEEVQRRRRRRWTKPPVVHLELTKSVEQAVASACGLAQREAVRSVVERDLAHGAHLERQRGRLDGGQEHLPDHYWLYGDGWRYHVVRESGRPALVVIGAKQRTAGQQDAARFHSWETPVAWKASRPLHHEQAIDVLKAVFEELDAFYERREEERARREEERLFGQWQTLLSAKEELEQGKEAPLRFTAVVTEGRRATFMLEVTREEYAELLDQERLVRGSGGRRGWQPLGIVDDASEQSVTLLFDQDVERLPMRGELVIDTRAGRVPIERQRDALNAVRFGNRDAVRDDLRSLLLDPSTSASPTVAAEVDWARADLDEDKKVAVATALGAPDFFVVHGPPGTGKTAFIAELVQQELRRNPDARILLTSQTHVALDNALERLRPVREARLVRLGRPDDPRISSSVRDLLLDRQTAEWAKAVRRRSEAFLADWAARAGLALDDVRAAVALRELAAVKQRDAELRRRNMELDAQLVGVDESEEPLSDHDREELREQLEQQKQARRRLRRDALTLGQQLRELGHPDSDTLEDATFDEVQQAAGQLLSRLTDGSERFQELVELQADWLERLADHTEFQGAFLQARHVIAGTCIGLGGIRALRELEFDVCILDEASKATATEALVPLARTRRWVLVGDARQLPPFQEEALQHAGLVEKYALDRQELRRTLFERLAEGLPSSCIKELTTQHRMARPIGDLISHCFYEGALQSVSERTLPGLALPAPVTWYDTSHLPNRFEEASGTGFRNRQEAKEVVELLEGLARCVERGLLDAPEGRRLSVLVMSGYLMQRDEIRKLLARRRLDRRLDVEVNTVDAVQGREADIAVFSVTRSNQEGRLGFLDVSPRINVALSRGRYGLAIFGDATFCAQNRTPLADVLRHVRGHPDGCAVVRVGQ